MEIIPVSRSRGGLPGPNCMTRTIRHGPKGRDLTMKSIDTPSVQPSACPPRSCSKCMGKSTKNVRCQYIQPPKVKNFAPINVYCPPVDRMENNTIYKGSYMPSDGDRPDPILPRHNLRMPTNTFSTNTIQKMSFPGWYNQEKVDPIIPCSHKLGGDGPISDDTTNRVDYVEKNINPAIPVLPKHNLFMTDAPFANATVNKLSYQPNEFVKKREPIVQGGTMVWPTGPLEQSTIQKMSFQPCKIPQKEFYPWAQKKKYTTPTSKMFNDTIYRKSYVPNENYVKVKPIIPEEQKKLLAEGDGFDGNTIYHMSYPGNDATERRTGFLPRHNIHLNTQRMETNTTQKLSFIPNYGVAPPTLIIPCSHQLGGQGPMQDMSTTMADYLEKDIDRVEQFKPKPNLFVSDCPFSNKTINRLSFMPPEPQNATTLIIPSNQYHPPTGPMANSTTQKMSYMPVGPVEPIEKPWATKKPYCPPQTKFVEDTCYRMSYDVPGEWINCDVDDGPCDCDCPPECSCPCPCPPVTVC